MPFFVFLIVFLLQVFIIESAALAEEAKQKSIAPIKKETLDREDHLSLGSPHFESRSFGHLVTLNNVTLNQGELSIGTLYAAYGVTDSLSIGFSPFAYLSFKTTNILLRWAQDISVTERLGFEAGYFNTMNPAYPDDLVCEWRDRECIENDPNKGGFRGFEMEIWDLKLAYSVVLEDFYRFSLALSYYYYINERRPFSLRMDPQNDDEYALNLTSLHEWRVAEDFFFNFELGAWGMNYKYPYVHAGATINLQLDPLFFGFGVSTTFSPGFPADRVRNFAGYDSTRSIHPEIQFQYFF